MKYVKILGLAAVLATALAALLGTASASATVLCKTYVSPCPAAWDYPANTVIHATLKPGTSLALRSTGGTLEATCAGSTIKGKTTNTGGEMETVNGNIEAFEFAECAQVSAATQLGTFEIHYVGPNTTGTLTSKNAKLTFVMAGLTCTYGTGAGTSLGVMESDETMTAELTVNATLNKAEGSFLCPSDSVLTASYVITAPTPLYFKKKTV
ncbi:MAG: hypothetical protein ACTHK3_00920 [Solirubrobacterales bacterium]